MALLAAGVVAMTIASSAAADGIPTGFHEPRPGLYTGGLPDADTLAAFKALGVGTVIDLRGNEERAKADTQPAAAMLGLQHEVLVIEGAADLTADNAERLKHALDAANGKVLLHCASGNRVGALLALMAHHEEGASRRQALELGRSAGLKSLEPEVDRRLRQSKRSR